MDLDWQSTGSFNNVLAGRDRRVNYGASKPWNGKVVAAEQTKATGGWHSGCAIFPPQLQAAGLCYLRVSVS